MAAVAPGVGADDRTECSCAKGGGHGPGLYSISLLGHSFNHASNIGVLGR